MFWFLDEAVADFRAGQFLELVDAAEREDEGDMLVEAEHITDAKINRMRKAARGMLHVATTEDHLARLRIGPRRSWGRLTPRPVPAISSFPRTSCRWLPGWRSVGAPGTHRGLGRARAPRRLIPGGGHDGKGPATGRFRQRIRLPTHRF